MLTERAIASFNSYGPFSLADSLGTLPSFFPLLAFFQVPSQVRMVGQSIWFGEEYAWVGGSPASRAAAATTGLNVEPGWKPPPPPIAASTFRLTMVSFFDLSMPNGRVWAIARILPVPGSTMVAAAETVSVTLTLLLTACWAAACFFGSSVVRMLRPPRSQSRWRSAAELPNAGSRRTTWRT
ncbi:hypothetical protein ASE03_23590 [Kitasatospora sp. Root187]|nr:hypothetical protein ASE03_23590 [Kitasatospora sp. Root187]